MNKLAGVGEALNLSLARQKWVVYIHPGLVAGVRSEGQSCGTKQLTLESVLTPGTRIESNQFWFWCQKTGIRMYTEWATHFLLSHLGLTVNPKGQSGYHYPLCRSEGWSTQRVISPRSEAWYFDVKIQCCDLLSYTTPKSARSHKLKRTPLAVREWKYTAHLFCSSTNLSGASSYCTYLLW